jgi:hypothetical protein
MASGPHPIAAGRNRGRHHFLGGEKSVPEEHRKDLLVGRLFRSIREQDGKRNLVIFVTARLVNSSANSSFCWFQNSSIKRVTTNLFQFSYSLVAAEACIGRRILSLYTTSLPLPPMPALFCLV